MARLSRKWFSLYTSTYLRFSFRCFQYIHPPIPRSITHTTQTTKKFHVEHSPTQNTHQSPHLFHVKHPQPLHKENTTHENHHSPNFYTQPQTFHKLTLIFLHTCFFMFHVKHPLKSHVSRGTNRNYRTSLIFSFIFSWLDYFACYLFAIFLR